ncbi:hypothetical protein MSG28_000786 [Choristoneura fumiferana]|uniref:Uncharacterized protein n=1 Tax=Choristoneura fumiferana TaxID=7141 RepID=A0ACC0K2U3_CHOFU|nr:hypothetical protein MSG28_000786 [Choristoneura fumiferana]
MASCCTCSGPGHGQAGSSKASLPLICLVPRDDARLADQGGAKKPRPASAGISAQSDFQLLDEDYIKKHFKLPQRQLYLDPFRRPLITFPMTQEDPYAKSEAEKRKETEEDEEIIYILQLPDWEYNCPVHNQTIKTPRFIWHSCKKPKKGKGGELKQGGGPMNKPKPWLLSRHTDFDLLSQW